MISLTRMLVAGLALLLAGCANTGGLGLGPKQTVGTLAGAGAGALAGSQIGGGRGKLVATSVGTLLGAFLGSSVGKSLDRADAVHAQRASYQALEFAPSGSPVGWSNPDTGSAGTITPTRTYAAPSGGFCREFSHNATIEGRSQRVFGTACRDDFGNWRVAGS